MNVTLKQLKAFIAVADAKSFADASASAFLSQPALSTAIKNLEDEVGGKLLIRTTRTMSLSPEGEAFLPIAKRLVADWDIALNDLYNLFAKKRGKINIAVMPSFAGTHLSSLLVDFKKSYPNINVFIDDVIAEEVNQRVLSGRAEIGITFKPEDLSELTFTPVFSDTFVVAMPANHALATKKRIDWKTLTQHPLVLLQRPSSIRHLIEQTLKDLELKVNIEMEAHQLATLGKMVSSGLGLSVVPSLSIQQMESLGAICKPLHKPLIQREVGIIARSSKPLSAAAQAMAEKLDAQWK